MLLARPAQLATTGLRSCLRSSRVNRNLRCFSTQMMKRNKNKAVEPDVTITEMGDLDKPIKYSTSPAAKWKASQTQYDVPDYVPWYQSYVIAGSITVFMIYFCILREENDVDLKLSRNLTDYSPNVKEIFKNRSPIEDPYKPWK